MPKFPILALVTALAALCLAPVRAEAQTVRAPGASLPGKMGVPQPEPLITLSVKNKSLGRILFEMFKQTPFQYKVESETGPTSFSLDVRQVPLTQALQQLLEQDKRSEPLVWRFDRSVSPGLFVVTREYVSVGIQEGEKRVSLSNARITRVIPELFKLMNVKGRIEPDVPPVLVTLELRPSEWANAFSQVMIEAHKVEPALTYSMDGDTWVVHVQKTPTGAGNAAQAAAARKVRLQANDVPLKALLAQLFQGSQWKYQVADSVGDPRITYVATNEPELVALQSILRQASSFGKQVTYREGKGVLYIEPGPLPGDFKLGRGTGVRVTSLDLKNQKISEIVRLLEGALGVTIKVAPNVPDLPIDYRIIEANAQEAIVALVDSARLKLPNIDFRPLGQGYEIVLK